MMAHFFGWTLIALIVAVILCGLAAQWRRARWYAHAQERRQWFEYSVLASRTVEEYHRQ